MIGAVAGAATGAKMMRYRAEYLHMPTSSRILFTVPVGSYEGEYLGTAGQAMAKRAAMKWIETTGIASECVLLDVVAVTDKMSVRFPMVMPRFGGWKSSNDGA